MRRVIKSPSPLNLAELLTLEYRTKHLGGGLSYWNVSQHYVLSKRPTGGKDAACALGSYSRKGGTSSASPKPSACPKGPSASGSAGPRPMAPKPRTTASLPAAVQVDPPAAAPVAGIAGPKTPGLGLSRRRVDPAQSDPGHPTPLRGPIPPLPGGAHPQAAQLEPPEASETCQPAGRRRHPALERGALACPEKKARDEGRTIVFVDETGCYLFPLVVRTYAPRGQTPLLRAPLSRDHLSVISGITPHGWLHTRIQDRPFRGVDAARFLRHLTTHVSVRLLVIWDGSPIHRCQEVKAFLASSSGQGVHLEQLPAYAPELNPDEGSGTT